MLGKKSFRWLSLFLFITFQFALVGAGFLVGVYSEEIFGLNRQFPVLSEAHQILLDNALYELPDQSKLEYGMVKGMVETAGDPYTTFIEPPEHKRQSEQLEGKYGGIGVRIEKSAKNQILLYPFPGSPAENAGLKNADRLDSIDSAPVKPDDSPEKIETALRGAVNSKVNISIVRDDQQNLNFQIVRAEYAIPSVTWNLYSENPKIGIVHATLVAETTPDEISRAIEDLKNQGAAYFILDLRNNSGGLVDAGVNIARLFLKDGQVITEKFKNKPDKVFLVENPGPFAALPLAVVANHTTASSAEIVAGSLQGAHRAKLVGSTTYGKNAIQFVFTLSDKSSLHVTAAKWLVPGLDQMASGKGLLPDIQLPEEKTAGNEVIEAAVNELFNPGADSGNPPGYPGP